MYCGLGTQISLWLAQGATIGSMPLIVQFAGVIIHARDVMGYLVIGGRSL